MVAIAIARMIVWAMWIILSPRDAHTRASFRQTLEGSRKIREVLQKQNCGEDVTPLHLQIGRVEEHAATDRTPSHSRVPLVRVEGGDDGLAPHGHSTVATLAW
jgi:hypothetical protein